MKNHEKFLEFNNNKIFFLNTDGIYWIALKPILDALNLESDRYLKRTKRDSFFGTRLDTVSIQVENNGIIQGRNMVCLPEKYIYGWICILNSDNKELDEYKETCYDLLYDHFHGTITNRKELLMKRDELDTKIHSIKMSLKEQDDTYKELQNLETQRKTVSTQLNSMDKEIIKDPGFWG
jgi:predicted ribosome quality control (RQC) complex YloA/Tae2 family protein